MQKYRPNGRPEKKQPLALREGKPLHRTNQREALALTGPGASNGKTYSVPSECPRGRACDQIKEHLCFSFMSETYENVTAGPVSVLVETDKGGKYSNVRYL